MADYTVGTLGDFADLDTALVGASINNGDTLTLLENQTLTQRSLNVGAGFGGIIIDGDGYEIDLDAGVASYGFFINDADVSNYTWRNIVWANSSGATKAWMRIFDSSSHLFDQCTFDTDYPDSLGTTATGHIYIYGTGSPIVTFRGCKGLDVPVLVYGAGTVAGGSITFESCKNSNIYKPVQLASGCGLDVIIKNTDSSGIWDVAGRSGYAPTITNSILESGITRASNPYNFVINTSGVPDLSNIKNNIFWNGVTGHPSAALFNEMIRSSLQRFAPDETNFMFDPDRDVDGLIQAGSFAAMRGDSANLPTLDINGDVFTLEDHIGPYPNPPKAIIENSSVYAFCGDSIPGGTGASSPATNSATPLFASDKSKSVAPYARAGIGGAESSGVFWGVDRVIAEHKAGTVFLSCGVNDINTENGAGSGYTTALTAGRIINTMKKVEALGSTPIWLGCAPMTGYENSSDSGTSAAVINTQDINDTVRAACYENNWAVVSWVEVMQSIEPVNWATTYYDDYTNDIHPNDTGHALIAGVMGSQVNQNDSGRRVGGGGGGIFGFGF